MRTFLQGFALMMFVFFPMIMHGSETIAIGSHTIDMSRDVATCGSWTFIVVNYDFPSKCTAACEEMVDSAVRAVQRTKKLRVTDRQSVRTSSKYIGVLLHHEEQEDCEDDGAPMQVGKTIFMMEEAVRFTEHATYVELQIPTGLRGTLRNVLASELPGTVQWHGPLVRALHRVEQSMKGETRNFEIRFSMTSIEGFTLYRD